MSAGAKCRGNCFKLQIYEFKLGTSWLKPFVPTSRVEDFLSKDCEIGPNVDTGVPYTRLNTIIIFILHGESKSASEILGPLMTLCNLMGQKLMFVKETGASEELQGQTNMVQDAQRGAETKLS